MEYEIEFLDETVVLRVRGEIDVCTSPSLKEQLLILVANKEQLPCLEIDLTDVTHLDSSGVAVLMRAWKRLNGEGRLLKLSNPSMSVRRIFSALDLNKYLES